MDDVVDFFQRNIKEYPKLKKYFNSKVSPGEPYLDEVPIKFMNNIGITKEVIDFVTKNQKKQGAKFITDTDLISIVRED